MAHKLGTQQVETIKENGVTQNQLMVGEWRASGERKSCHRINQGAVEAFWPWQVSTSHCQTEIPQLRTVEDSAL